MTTVGAMHVLRFDHRRVAMVAVLLLPSVILVVTAVFVMSMSVIPTPDTPSHAREQQRQDQHFLEHRGLLLAHERELRFFGARLRCYLRHRAWQETRLVDQSERAIRSVPPALLKPALPVGPGRDSEDMVVKMLTPVTEADLWKARGPFAAMRREHGNQERSSLQIEVHPVPH